MIAYREARPEDATALAELGRATFDDAFAHLYTPADLGAFYDQTYTPEAIEREIASPQRLYRLAEQGGVLVGYIKLGFDASLDWDAQGERTLELKQLYLRGAATGSGIGSVLTEWAFAEGRARGFEAIILSVYSENHGGQRFYRRHGFEKWADTTFRVGEQVDSEFIFGRML